MKPEARPGTYVLWLRCTTEGERPIGRLGILLLQPGYYAYVGSAFGPGGLGARIRRHLRKSKPRHWHIDHLRCVTDVEAIWYAHGSRSLEHRWAERLGRSPGARIPLPGFGSSDCRCATHLFHFEEMPQPFREAELRHLDPE